MSTQKSYFFCDSILWAEFEIGTVEQHWWRSSFLLQPSKDNLIWKVIGRSLFELNCFTAVYLNAMWSCVCFIWPSMVGWFFSSWNDGFGIGREVLETVHFKYIAGRLMMFIDSRRTEVVIWPFVGLLHIEFECKIRFTKYIPVKSALSLFVEFALATFW